MKKLLFFLFILFLKLAVTAQEAVLYGRITDEFGNPIEHVFISNSLNNNNFSTGKEGRYEITLPSGKEVTVAFRNMSYADTTLKMFLKPGEKKRQDLTLIHSGEQLDPVQVRARHDDNFTRVNPKVGFSVPSPMGGAESLIKSFAAGVRSSNELSSQYSVRGGNFDENLVYVNDIEIYRPFLIRSGQQEGLSFVNLDLTAAVKFSSGGFECQYGDKLSSVLDIEYKKPVGFASSFSASFLGFSAHTEGIVAKKREGVKRQYFDKLNLSVDSTYFSYLIGFRYKSNAYLLKSLNTKGDYKPNFLDLQTLLVWNINSRFEINFLGNLANNKYIFSPTYGESTFGPLGEIKRLKVAYEGQEINAYQNYLGALTFKYRVTQKDQLRFIVSSFFSKEKETFDIEGQYLLSDIDVDMGEGKTEETSTTGVGTYIDHGRNYLKALVTNGELRGDHKLPKRNTLSWGVKLQSEIFDDKIKEWHLIDSSGYFLPHSSTMPGEFVPEDDPSRTLTVADYVKNGNHLSTFRWSGFIQDSWAYGNDSTHRLIITGGVRLSYWSFNKELLASPRLSFIFKPRWKSDWDFCLKTGVYSQPPFFREMQYSDGSLNHHIKSQRSYQAVLGANYNFLMWRRPFKFTAETYYKHIFNVIPYEIDKLRLVYTAENEATAFATGIDLRLSGEFVEGLESWVSLSFLTTMENHVGDTLGFVPRPTDQKWMINLFFQDRFPMIPQFRVHLNFLFGSGLPFSPPGDLKTSYRFRSPWYRRVDLGFSYLILSPQRDRELSKNKALKTINSLSVYFEVFNLLSIKNVASYNWVKDINNVYWAIPTTLTARLINVKFLIEF